MMLKEQQRRQGTCLRVENGSCSFASSSLKLLCEVWQLHAEPRRGSRANGKERVMLELSICGTFGLCKLAFV